MRRVLAVLVVLAALLGIGAYGVSRISDFFHIPFLTDSCLVAAEGHQVTLKPDQITNAATITAVAVQRKLPERAVTIALATALQESKLRNLPNGDRDSVGLFQQRPSQGWGDPEQLQNPRYAAGKFYDHLVKVDDWQTMRLTDAAQAVQLSGHPELYQQWESDSQAMAAAFLGRVDGAVTCQLREPVALTGTSAAAQIAAELKNDYGLAVSSDESGTRASRQSDESPDGPTLRVTVNAPALGWRTAHWFVAKSHDYGVQRVVYGGKEWTPETGEWVDSESESDGVEVFIAAEG